MGIYIPPNCTMGVDDLRVAWSRALQTAPPLLSGTSTSGLRTPPMTGQMLLLTCWRRSTPPISLANFFLDNAASNKEGRAGPSACQGGGRGATHNQIIFWGMSASQRGLGGWHFSHHGSTTWTIGWLSQPSGGGARVNSSHTNATNSASLLSFPKGRRLNAQRRSVVLLQSASNLSCASGMGMTGSLTRHGPWSGSGRPCGESGNCRVQRGDEQNVSSGLPSTTIGRHTQRALATRLRRSWQRRMCRKHSTS
jgi:hypothetical protein